MSPVSYPRGRSHRNWKHWFSKQHFIGAASVPTVTTANKHQPGIWFVLLTILSLHFSSDQLQPVHSFTADSSDLTIERCGARRETASIKNKAALPSVGDFHLNTTDSYRFSVYSLQTDWDQLHLSKQTAFNWIHPGTHHVRHTHTHQKGGPFRMQCANLTI